MMHLLNKLYPGSLLLEELTNAYGGEAIKSIMEACQSHFSESCQAKGAGSADWWRVSEHFSNSILSFGFHISKNFSLYMMLLHMLEVLLLFCDTLI